MLRRSLCFTALLLQICAAVPLKLPKGPDNVVLTTAIKQDRSIAKIESVHVQSMSKTEKGPVLILPNAGFVDKRESLQGNSGDFMSPNFPENYDNLINVTYNIQVPTGHFVYLTFYTFETEECCDKVYVFEGQDLSGTLIDTVSGKQSGKTVQSSGPYMTIQFLTDPITTFSGFYAEFLAIPNGSVYVVPNVCPVSAYNLPTEVDDFSIIASPNFPENYNNLADCGYTITADYGQRVQFELYAFNTEKCCDYLQIYDGSDDSGTLLAKLSGDINDMQTTTFTSTGQYMYLHFVSDLDQAAPGFSALATQLIEVE